MKILLPIVIFIVSLLTISFSTKKLKKQAAKEQTGFVLVELFTSEGCSSCPPADALAEEIQKKYADENVLVLGYHVDYWDRLGWKDPFSSNAFTQRQEYYSNLFRLNSIYTPQVVVNGKEEFVGSNRSKLQSAISKNLDQNITGGITLNASSVADQKVRVEYATPVTNSSDDQLILLLVQKMATNQIKRGENQGKTLHHINIVRKYVSLKATDKTEMTTFDLPDGLPKSDFFVAAFTQNKKTGKIFSIESAMIK